MALDIRLDFISEIDPIVINQMSELRQKFIDLDNELQQIINEMNGDSSGLRAVSLARTNLETSSMYAIKSLCILGEKS